MSMNKRFSKIKKSFTTDTYMSVLILIALILVIFAVIRVIVADQKALQIVKQEKTHKTIIMEGLLKNYPKDLQKSFTESVKLGESDKYAKSAAYFVMHRYFDNKGDIYELYDYSNSDPVLSFLKDAEQIYPDIFLKIKNKQLPTTFSEEGMYAYLAYLEVLDKKGYGDIALQGTAANQYAKMAYIGKSMSKDKNIKNLSPDQKRNLDKAMLFAKNASTEVASMVNSRTIPDSVYVADVVIGLNQYAYALRYFKYFELPFNSPKTSEEIFALTTEYTSKKIPELSMFTHLINASSLVLIHGNVAEITTALKPLTDYNPVILPPVDHSVIDRVLKARLDVEKEGVYSKQNIVSIAVEIPKFKMWLLAFGWKESDFE